MADRPLRIAKTPPSDVTAALDRVYREVDATLELLPPWIIRQMLGRAQWQEVERARHWHCGQQEPGDASM